MHTLPKSYNKPAFTLIEILIYTLILGIFAVLVSNVLFQVLRLQSFITDRALLAEDLNNFYKILRDDTYLADSISVNPSGELVIISSFSATPSITYYEQNDQIFRVEDLGTPVAITREEVEVFNFNVIDRTTENSAEIVEITVGLRNYEAGRVKPAVELEVTSSHALKYVL